MLPYSDTIDVEDEDVPNCGGRFGYFECVVSCRSNTFDSVEKEKVRVSQMSTSGIVNFSSCVDLKEH